MVRVAAHVVGLGVLVVGGADPHVAVEVRIVHGVGDPATISRQGEVGLVPVLEQALGGATLEVAPPDFAGPAHVDEMLPVRRDLESMLDGIVLGDALDLERRLAPERQALVGAARAPDVDLAAGFAREPKGAVIRAEDGRGLGLRRAGDPHGLAQLGVHDVEVAVEHEGDLARVVGERGFVSRRECQPVHGVHERRTVVAQRQRARFEGAFRSRGRSGEVHAEQVHADADHGNRCRACDGEREHALVFERGEATAVARDGVHAPQVERAVLLAGDEHGLATFDPHRPAIASIVLGQRAVTVGAQIVDPRVARRGAVVALAPDRHALARVDQLLAVGRDATHVGTGVEQQLRPAIGVDGLAEEATRVVPLVVAHGTREQRGPVGPHVVGARALRVEGQLLGPAARPRQAPDLLIAAAVAGECDPATVRGDDRAGVVRGMERKPLHAAAFDGRAPEVSAPGHDHVASVGRDVVQEHEADGLERLPVRPGRRARQRAERGQCQEHQHARLACGSLEPRAHATSHPRAARAARGCAGYPQHRRLGPRCGEWAGSTWPSGPGA